jgi:hypothetical protein
LPFYKLELTPDGRLQVDNAKVVPSTYYLTAEGKEIEGPTPDGSDIKFS